MKNLGQLVPGDAGPYVWENGISDSQLDICESCGMSRM